jgi:2-(1,2-epoxy-1,2-dihydrophenyl)acetyl-CoA isomerase
MPSSTAADPVLLTLSPTNTIATITLNRPEALNALDLNLVTQFRQHIATISKNDAIRVVIINAAGKGFCSGAEMKATPATNQSSSLPPLNSKKKLSPGASVGQSMREKYNPLMNDLYQLKKPIIVAVQGVCAGGGVGLALVGDIVIASESASFVQVFAPKLGLIPDMGSSWMVPRLVGRAQAMGMSMLGQPISGKEAEKLGLIWKCVGDHELTSTVQTIANQLASGPTQAFVSLRTLLDKSWNNGFMEQVNLECEIQEMLGEQPDYSIGVKAFRTKTKPEFTGKAKL